MPELRFGKAQLCPWLCPMLLAWHWTDHFCFRTRQTWAYWWKSNKEPPRCRRAWSTSPLRRCWESWGCSAWGEEAQGGAHSHPQTPEGRAQKTEMGTWGWTPCSGWPCWSGAEASLGSCDSMILRFHDSVIRINLSFSVKTSAVFTDLWNYHPHETKNTYQVWSCAAALLRLIKACVLVLKQGLEMFTVKINGFFRWWKNNVFKR